MDLRKKINTAPVKPVKTVEETYNVVIRGADQDDETAEVTVSKRNVHSYLRMDISQSPITCSMFELGSFGLRDSKGIPKSELNKGIIELFKRIISCHTLERGTKTFYFTLVNNSACNAIRDALKGSDLFTIVKTFNNTNGNQNILYVSNNI